MTREEMIERALAMRARDLYGKVDESVLAPYASMQREETIEGVHCYVITPSVPSPRPLVINFHGGGFIKGRQAKDQLFCSRLAQYLGATVIDVDYSLAPEHPFPEAQEECARITEYAFTHAEELGIDNKKILLAGHSAGGNLAITTCIDRVRKHQSMPAALIAEFCPLDLATDPEKKPRVPTDMPAHVARTYNAFYASPETAKTALCSPLFASESDLEGFPPTLIMSAGLDSLHLEDEEFALALARAGVNVTVRCFRNSHHGFTINQSDEAAESLALLYSFANNIIRP